MYLLTNIFYWNLVGYQRKIAISKVNKEFHGLQAFAL